MRKGKMVAQGAHASLGAILGQMTAHETGLFLDLSDMRLTNWINGRFKKICVAAKDEAEIDQLFNDAIAAGLIATKIVDSGLTEFNGVHTVTALAIGPDFENKVDAITKHLPLL